MSRIQGIFNETENKEIYLSSTYVYQLSNWQLICATILTGKYIEKNISKEQFYKQIDYIETLDLDELKDYGNVLLTYNLLGGVI